MNADNKLIGYGIALILCGFIGCRYIHSKVSAWQDDRACAENREAGKREVESPRKERCPRCGKYDKIVFCEACFKKMCERCFDTDVMLHASELSE